MIITKLLGSAILTVGALKCYLEVQRFQKKRIKQLNAFIELIEYIKNQIECFLLPLDSIISSCDTKLLCDCGIEKEVRHCKNMKELISSTIFYCDEEVISILWQFADNFGRNYSREQVIACEYYKNELIKKREKALEKDAKNQKIQLAICLSISFSFIILLI